jgi:transposase
MYSNINLPGFEEVTITRMEELDGRFCIHAEMQIKPHKCPVCNSFTKKVHDYRIQKIKHLKIFERHTLIFYKRRRYGCPCGKKFAEKNPFVERYQRLSIELNQAEPVRKSNPIHCSTSCYFKNSLSENSLWSLIFCYIVVKFYWRRREVIPC